MAIPISKYISTTSRVVNDVMGNRDWSGLVFSKVAMKTGASKKTDYETNLKVVSLTQDEVAAQFDDASFLAFCNQYFAYTGGTKKPSHINLAYVGAEETAGDAFTRVTVGTATVEAFCNFGAFAFYGAFTRGAVGDEGLLDVSTANNGNEFGWVMVVETNATNQAADSAAYMGKQLTHLTHDAVDALAWYAAVDYEQAGAAGTIDYKQFSGSTATITTGSDKDTADGLRVNYIGKVQNYGAGLSFYQTGVNMDGTDIGVVRDMCWANSEIVKGYFNLQASQQKLPANYVGAAMVRNIICEVATRGISNGVILADKPLTSAQKAAILAYTNDEAAVDSVVATGYYVDTKIVLSNNKYVCQYTLVYAKGDHISKVDGVHILV